MRRLVGLPCVAYPKIIEVNRSMLVRWEKCVRVGPLKYLRPSRSKYVVEKLGRRTTILVKSNSIEFHEWHPMGDDVNKTINCLFKLCPGQCGLISQRMHFL